MTKPLFNEFFPEHLVAFSSNRAVDFSFENGLFDLSERQKKSLADFIGMDLSRVANIWQVQGDRVLEVTESYLKNGRKIEEADGLLTDRLQLPLVIRTADCLPVFIHDEKQNVIGLIHIGWRGSRKEILSKTLKLMCDQWQSRPDDLKIAFGPAIRSCCYQVGEEFCQFFGEDVYQKGKQYFFDLPQANIKQLKKLGVPKENVFDVGICSCCNKDYFSYRREGENVGRMISLMMLKP